MGSISCLSVSKINEISQLLWGQRLLSPVESLIVFQLNNVFGNNFIMVLFFSDAYPSMFWRKCYELALFFCFPATLSVKAATDVVTPLSLTSCFVRQSAWGLSSPRVCLFSSQTVPIFQDILKSKLQTLWKDAATRTLYVLQKSETTDPAGNCWMDSKSSPQRKAHFLLQEISSDFWSELWLHLLKLYAIHLVSESNFLQCQSMMHLWLKFTRCGCLGCPELAPIEVSFSTFAMLCRSLLSKRTYFFLQ